MIEYSVIYGKCGITKHVLKVDKSQNEVDRLLDILKEMEEEKNEKEKQLQELQE